MQELYEKHRDGVLDNEEVWKALFDRDLAVLPDILGHEDEVRAALREAELTPDERAEVYAAHEVKPLWPAGLYDDIAKEL